MLIRYINECDAILKGSETQKGKKKRNEESPECSLNICGWYLSLSFWGDCAQHRLPTRTDSQPIRSLTRRSVWPAGLGSDLRAGVIPVPDWGDDFCAFASTRLQHRRGCEVRGTLCRTERSFLFGVCADRDSSGSDAKPQEVTTDTRRTENRKKNKLTAAPDQLQNWGAQVGSLEYKNTWFSEEGGRNTLRSTKCSNGVSKTYLLFIQTNTKTLRNADFLLPKLASVNDHQRNVPIPNHGSHRAANVHTFHDASFGAHL